MRWLILATSGFIEIAVADLPLLPQIVSKSSELLSHPVMRHGILSMECDGQLPSNNRTSEIAPGHAARI